VFLPFLHKTDQGHRPALKEPIVLIGVSLCAVGRTVAFGSSLFLCRHPTQVMKGAIHLYRPEEAKPHLFVYYSWRRVLAGRVVQATACWASRSRPWRRWPLAPCHTVRSHPVAHSYRHGAGRLPAGGPLLVCCWGLVAGTTAVAVVGLSMRWLLMLRQTGFLISGGRLAGGCLGVHLFLVGR
jgi:hypothetical protein